MVMKAITNSDILSWVYMRNCEQSIPGGNIGLPITWVSARIFVESLRCYIFAISFLISFRYLYSSLGLGEVPLSAYVFVFAFSINLNVDLHLSIIIIIIMFLKYKII